MFGIKNKIFCISMQRTGTTSVGEFFKINGFKVAGYRDSARERWTKSWFLGDYDTIFKSKNFRKNQVFEDDPWWCPDFYKFLYHQFPKARFILFERDSDRWFQSMLNHSNGKNPGNTLIHSKIYRRENDYYRLIKQKPELEKDNFGIDNLLDISLKKSHYVEFYERHNFEVKRFFQKMNPDRLFQANLEDPEKWNKMAGFFKIKIPIEFEVHENKSK